MLLRHTKISIFSRIPRDPLIGETCNYDRKFGAHMNSSTFNYRSVIIAPGAHFSFILFSKRTLKDRLIRAVYQRVLCTLDRVWLKSISDGSTRVNGIVLRICHAGDAYFCKVVLSKLFRTKMFVHVFDRSLLNLLHSNFFYTFLSSNFSLFQVFHFKCFTGRWENFEHRVTLGIGVQRVNLLMTQNSVNLQN